MHSESHYFLADVDRHYNFHQGLHDFKPLVEDDKNNRNALS